MSPISIALNLLLSTLLVAALMFGWVLNRRLKALKDSHAGFADAVANLDRAAQRAETGLADLRSATDQAVDLLSSRILKARDMADNLDRLTAQGAALLERRGAERSAAPPTPRAIAERIAAERAGRSPEPLDRPLTLHPQSSYGRAASTPTARFPVTTEEEALAAAESLILKLSQSEALTSEPPMRRAPPIGQRPDVRAAPAPAPARRAELQPEPQPAPRPEPRVNPRSRAQIDDDLFEPPAQGRFRTFDGGLA